MDGYGIKCDGCGSYDVHVIESRPSSSNTRMRQYECNQCGHRFRTVELAAAAHPGHLPYVDPLRGARRKV